MWNRTRLLIVYADSLSTRLVVCEDARIILEEEVFHESAQLSARKNEILEALHTKGMNLTRLNAVIAWTVGSSGFHREERIQYSPVTGIVPGCDRRVGQSAASELVDLIAGQLNISCFTLDLSGEEVEINQVVRRAVQIYQKGV
jgi:butyrate kinase